MKKEKRGEAIATLVIGTMLLGGAILIGSGLWLIYPPASMIVLGMMSMYAASKYLGR